VSDRDGLPPLHLQLAGPAARPSGHPDHAFGLEQLAIGEYPTPEDAVWLRGSPAITAVVSLQDDADLDRRASRSSRWSAPTPPTASTFIAFRCRTATASSCAPASMKRSASSPLLARGERVYLHCNAGLNRAPTVAIAYLHAHRGYALQDACDFVKARRPCVPYMRLLSEHYT
jgi:hypothetical protein